jgi:hypothetical protein
MPESYRILGCDHVTVAVTVTGLRAGRISEEQQIFLFSKAIRLALGPDRTHVQGLMGFFPTSKEARVWSSRLTLSSTDVKNERSYSSYWYSDWLRAGRSGNRIPVRVRFFAHVHTGPGAHPASCTVCTGSFPGVKRLGRGADHPPPPSAEVDNE